MTKKVDDQIAVLKSFHNVTTDAELAASLGVAANTVSSWRGRGSLPERHRTAAHVFDSLAGGEGTEVDTPILPSFRALTQMSGLERQALMVGLVRFVNEHPGFGSRVEDSIKVAAQSPEMLASYAHHAYLDIVEMHRADHIAADTAATLLILRYLGTDKAQDEG